MRISDWSSDVCSSDLVYGGACLASERPGLPAALRLLEAEIARQVLPDGGHAERSPVVQLEVLRHLVEMRAMLAAAKGERDRKSVVAGKIGARVDLGVRRFITNNKHNKT